MKFIYILLLFSFVSLRAQQIQVQIDSLEKLIPKENSKEQQLLDQAELVFLYFKGNDLKKALTIYHAALLEAKVSHQEKAEAQLYHIMGNMQFYQYEIDSAISYFKKALVIRKRIKDNPGTLKTTSNLAANYFMKSDFKNSLTYFKEGLQLESELGYEEGKYVDIKNMAVAFRYLKLYGKTLDCYRRAEKFTGNTSKNFYTIYSGMAMTYQEMKLYDSALFYGLKSHEIAKTLNDSIDLAYSLSNLGLIYHSLGKAEVSKAYFKQSLQITIAAGEKRLEMGNWANLAAYYLDKNSADSADSYIVKVIELMNQLNIKTDLEDLSKLLGDYYHRKKDYEKSYAYFKMYDSYKDSIYTLESTAKLLEAHEKFESEKKEKENQLLQVENRSYKTSRNYLFIILLISIAGIILIFSAYRKILASRKLLSIQKDLIVEKQKEILDSIQYAKRIQFALLASDSLLNKNLPEHFIFFKPKDVVSGDFYWAAATDEGFVYLTGDCTGHGVPGAFMSLLLITKLNQAVTENKIQRPDLILNQVRNEIVKALNPEGSIEESKDGMDAVICKLNFTQKKLEFAAANNSFYIIRNDQLLVCKADKMAVGKGYGDSSSFTYNEIQLQPGDLIYTFTDGFADQFGGTAGKKFKYKQFESLLLHIHKEPMNVQKEKLQEAFEAWKGNLEQVDDVCLMGVKIT